MKRLILNMLVLALFLAGLVMVCEHTGWAAESANGQINCLSEDPNEPDEPEPEMV